MKKLMILAVALVALIASPAAAQYSGATLVLSDSSIAAGDSVEFTCTGLEPGAAYSVTFDGEEVGTGTADADGTVFGTFTSDSDTPPGTYELAVVTDGGSCTASLEILGATDNAGGNNPGSNGTQAGTTGSGTLPRTGASSNTRTIAMVGAGLLALGGMVTLTMRRKAFA